MNEVLEGDCLEVMPRLPTASVDLIVTDPPYFRVKNLPWDRQWDSADGFLAWLDRVLVEFGRLLRPNGSLYVFASPRLAARVEVLVGERFNVLNHIVWNKVQSGAQRADKGALRAFFGASERVIFAEPWGADGSYTTSDAQVRAGVFEPLRAWLDAERSAAGVTPEDCNEICGHRREGGMAGRHYFSPSQWRLPTAENYVKLQAATGRFRREYEDLRREYEDLRREYEDLRRPFNATPDRPYTDVWTYPTVPHRPGKHPCEKPQDLLRHIIQTSSRPGAVVLDAFAGSGSTLEAAAALDRQYIGIEKDPEWVARARARLAATQTPLLTAAD